MWVLEIQDWFDNMTPMLHMRIFERMNKAEYDYKIKENLFNGDLSNVYIKVIDEGYNALKSEMFDLLNKLFEVKFNNRKINRIGKICHVVIDSEEKEILKLLNCVTEEYRSNKGISEGFSKRKNEIKALVEFLIETQKQLFWKRIRNVAWDIIKLLISGTLGALIGYYLRK